MKRFLLDAGMRVAHVAGEREPRWQMLFPLGAVKHRPDFPNGSATFDAGFLGSLLANFQTAQAAYRGAGAFALQLNYYHPADEASIDDKVAAGWIEDVKLIADGEAKGRGLWGLTRWTERAAGYIERDELRCLSPEFAFNHRSADTGKPQGPTLFGAALLNTPFLAELPRVAASATSPAEPSATTGAPHMDKKKICALLGLPEDTSDEAVMVALGEMSAKAHKMSAEMEKVGLERKGEVTALAATKEALTAETEKVTKLAATVKEMGDAKAKSDVEALVMKLKREGRIQANQGEAVEKYAAALGIEEAGKFFGALSPVVTLGEQGVRGTDTPNPDEARTKLRAVADEMVKNGTPRGGAMLLAMEKHPELAAAADAKKATPN